MANLRNLKKEIDYRLEEVVFDCDMAICFQPSKEKEVFEVMQEAVAVRNDLFTKANNPAEPQIEKNRIDKSLSSQCRYLKIELENLQKSFLNNDFYEYYRAGRTELDNRYFIRENYDILSDIHCHLLDRDISFTTLHDSSVAEILANNRLIEYVSEEIEQLTEKLHLKFTSIVDSKLLQWTDSKVALVEFIYALYAGKCFSNGNTSLKDIAFCCETLFNIEIGDFYRIFLEIRNRKKSRTQFLDKLKEQIIKMMDELDR